MKNDKKNGPSDDDHGGLGTPGDPDIPEGKGLQKEQQSHQGKLLLDATCAPANIAYPTDLRLLNKVREKLEGMIDPYRGER